MGRYVIRRLLQAVLTLSVVLFMLHYLMSLAIQINGNPVRTFFGDKPVSDELLQATMEKFNLDDPCLKSVGDPCWGMFTDRMQQWSHFDFGTDFQSVKIGDSIANAIPVTLTIFAITTVVWALFGVTAGVLAAMNRGRFIDYLVRIGTTFTLAIPGFLMLILVQNIFGVIIGNWFREQFGRESFLSLIFQPTYSAKAPFLSLVIPGIALGVFGIAGITRLSRTSMLENLRSDFVRTAKAKGLKRTRVTIVHTLRNSLIPVVTVIGFALGDALGGSVVLEGLYNIPGLGLLAFNGVKTNDTAVVIAVVALASVVFMVTNLIVDLFYAVLDPRIRYE
ncbi:putative dipeptide-transport integral membrane protein ABC transporter DppB [Actinorhabdospora filicis]|uniref:Dipeptide-transport integral membrane protein ABC transporter DppB n=1 Tax=Actinorhabdospora filicis TaxID=1785913 RepID=A0A9W6WCH3_9ACTN|nr:ABC transporter permease [Actinorhabdospora filicis]GLZ81083.1 putative dipeptide-transport integral membrane protein ABC transporter DppB [Actinorhabdospora filicis]